jgi:hypothetical protein
VAPPLSPELALVDPELRRRAIAALPDLLADGFLPRPGPRGSAAQLPVLKLVGVQPSAPTEATSHFLEAIANEHRVVVDVEPLPAGALDGVQSAPLPGFPDVVVIEVPVTDTTSPPLHLVEPPAADDAPAPVDPRTVAAPALPVTFDSLTDPRMVVAAARTADMSATQSAALVPVGSELVPATVPATPPRYRPARFVGGMVAYAVVQAAEFALIGALVIAVVVLAVLLATVL